MTCTYTAWILMLAAAAGGVDAAKSTAVRTNAQVRDSQPVSLIRISPTTEEFQQRVTAGVQSIPTHVWQGLASAGWQICTAEFVVDAVPSLKGVHPRGWPRGMTWENADAVHLPKRRMLVIAEKLHNR